jgi:hypothetical protein
MRCVLIGAQVAPPRNLQLGDNLGDSAVPRLGHSHMPWSGAPWRPWTYYVGAAKPWRRSLCVLFTPTEDGTNMICHATFSSEMSLLVAVFITFVGAGLMPGLIVVARFAVWLAIQEAISTALSELVKWVAITAATVALGLTVARAPAAAVEKPSTVPSAAALLAPGTALDTAITQTFARVITAGAKPMPVWMLDTAARIYTAYRIHQVGDKADEAGRIALAVLTEVAHLRSEIEAGRITEQEQDTARTRLEEQATVIEGLAKRVGEVEQRTNRLEQKTNDVVGVVTRSGCPPLHAWDRKLGQCTNRQ